ncbi:MAG: hypothetical protein SVV67_07500 [Bacillota bacterium]|nr:hypothetical protein [Bacillota bacterium]
MSFLKSNYLEIFLAAGKNVPVPTGNLIFFGILIIAVGLASLIYPQIFWHLRVGRKVPDMAPNRAYLTLLRFGGILVIILGLVMLDYCGLFGR